MSHGQNSLKGDYIENVLGSHKTATRLYAKSFDHGSHDSVDLQRLGRLVWRRTETDELYASMCIPSCLCCSRRLLPDDSSLWPDSRSPLRPEAESRGLESAEKTYSGGRCATPEIHVSTSAALMRTARQTARPHIMLCTACQRSASWPGTTRLADGRVPQIGPSPFACSLPQRQRWFRLMQAAYPESSRSATRMAARCASLDMSQSKALPVRRSFARRTKCAILRETAATASTGLAFSLA